MKNSNTAAVAAFLAQGGKVRKVAPEASVGLTTRDWAAAARGNVTRGNARFIKGAAARSQTVQERRHELAHDFAFVGDDKAAQDALAGLFDLK